MRKTKRQVLEGTDGNEVEKSKFIDRNTLEIYFKNHDRAIRLHNTNVVTYKGNGDIVLNSGGYQTQTTKDRINKFSPVTLTQKSGVWYINNNTIFYDNIVLTSEGQIKSEVKTIDFKKRNALKKDIAKYIKLIDTLDVIPVPSNGDCWYCLMQAQDGKSLGDSFGDTSHLLSHIKDGYIVGTLLVRAMLEAGYQTSQIRFHFETKITCFIKNALRKYLYKRLLTTV